MMSRTICWGILVLLGCTASLGADGHSRPNVLFIAVDDLNHWIGHLGRNEQTITPNLDRLANMGVSFSHAYCAAPACNPSRAALMSGIRPSTSGIYNNSDDYRPLSEAEMDAELDRTDAQDAADEHESDTGERDDKDSKPPSA